MLIGIVGKPSTGKSSLFNALTHGHAAVANYPFTTIDPNKGVAFVRVKCACTELGVKCKPRFGSCANGVRLVPVNVVDVAGLVEGAHEGRGKGNQFLNDLNAADALVCVADAAGATDDGGNACAPGTHDAARDVRMVESEIDYWILGILKRNLAKAKGKRFDDFAALLSGIRVNRDLLKHCVDALGLSENTAEWKNEAQLLELARALRKRTKPLVIAANKIDLSPAAAGVEKLKKEFSDYTVVPIAADAELALQRAREKNWIEYDSAAERPEIKIVAREQELDERIETALRSIEEHVLRKWGSTGVQRLLEAVVFKTLGFIVVFPVEDEKHFADHFGNALPDAILLPKGSTPLALAEAIHSDLAKHMLYAVNARNKMRLAHDYALQNGDVIKIVSAK
ncbi:MAG: YchF-related putative GTPase [Candidatus Norongarragalinales archaeon]